MLESKIGSVVVVDPTGRTRPVGIVTGTNFDLHGEQPTAGLPRTSRRIPPARWTTACGSACRFSHQAGSAAPQPFIAIETRLGPSS
jgi:hypothetical protein